MNVSAYRGCLFSANSIDDRLSHVFRIRKKIFVDHYSWDIPHDDETEIDQFDHANAIYGLLCHKNQPFGVFRAIRCDRRYLAKSLFPELATKHKFPSDPRHWEISRFGVLPSAAYKRLNSQMLYAFMFRFALEVNARSLVAMTDRNHERLLSLFGISTIRYGPSRNDLCTCKDKLPLEVVAGEIPMDSQTSPKANQLLNLATMMEIEDVASIFRPTSLSA
ncbi:MAG: hypothetical protein N4A65_00660 [Cohaesibacter sp.]|jgi:acyl homoserine lactone synthase|nr:hypothetical protein [Cohaesibacter sp.]